MLLGQEIDSKQIQANKAYITFHLQSLSNVRHIIPALTKLAGEWHGPDYRFIAISANDPVEYPSDAPDKMRQVALDLVGSFRIFLMKARKRINSLNYMYTRGYGVCRWSRLFISWSV